MTRKARIIGETSSLNALARFGSEARTLGSYLDEAVNGELPFNDPFGGKHVVSLTPFAGEDPNRYLMLRVAVAQEDKDFPPDYSDAVVLKEYELPPGTKTLP
jgi:hypothetical protein